MKTRIIFAAIVAGVIFAPLSYAHDDKGMHGGMREDHAQHGHMGAKDHDAMWSQCQEQMKKMNMPASTTKEQHSQMMEQCMKTLEKEKVQGKK